MRPEYFEAIRYRRWSELEFYAKKWPEQALADTVYQLAETIGSKPDRKALKRILWILEREGFSGRDYEDRNEPSEKMLRSRKFLMAGICVDFSKDATHFFIMGRRGAEYEVLLVAVRDSDREYHLETLGPGRITGAPNMVKLWESVFPENKCEVDPNYVAGRILEALRTGSPSDTSIKLPSWWQRAFESAEAVSHPSCEISVRPMTSSGRQKVLQSVPLIGNLFIPFYADNEMWTDFHAVRWFSDIDDSQKKAEIHKILMDSLDRVITDDLVEDYEQRLLDTAYILHCQGNPNAGGVIELAKDFALRRERSDFGQRLLLNTAISIVDLPLPDEDDYYSSNVLSAVA